MDGPNRGRESGRLVDKPHCARKALVACSSTCRVSGSDDHSVDLLGRGDRNKFVLHILAHHFRVALGGITDAAAAR